MSNIPDSEVNEKSLSSDKGQLKLSKSNQKSQSSTRDSNSSIKQLNFTTSPVDTADKTKKTPIIPSLTIQARRSSSPQQSFDPKNSTQNNPKSQHRIQMQDISPMSHKNARNDSSNQQSIVAPPIPRLNFSGISRSCQSLNLNRAPIPPMNVAMGSRKTVSGFNIDLPEEYSSKNVNRPVLICVPWTTIPTSAGANQANKNYNIDNNLRSENGYSHKSQKVQSPVVNLNTVNNNPNSNHDFDDTILSELINSTFYSNRIFSTPDVLPNTVIIEEDEVTNASTCNSSRSTESSTSSPRSLHNAHNSLKLSRVNLNRNTSLASNSSKIDHPSNNLYRTSSLTPNSTKSFNFLNTASGVAPNVVSEVSSDSIPSLQAIDSAYQKVQHFPSLIEQTNSESTHLTTYIESIIAEIELCREEKEKIHVQNEIIRSNIRQAKEEIKILSQSQEKMQNVVKALKQRNESKS